MTAKRGLAHCALLFATPVTEEDFYTVMQGGPLVDYAAASLRGESAASLWNRRYRHIVSAAQDLIGTALELGGKVYTQIGLDEVAQATAQCDTVILLAHWRGAGVNPGELRQSRDEWFEVWSRHREHPVVALLGDVPPDAVTLAERLNRLIERGDLLSSLPASIGVAARQSATLAQALSRDLIDEIFATILPPGNRIELYDGQHTPAAFEQSIDVDFEGEIDLATCNSQVLATVLDLRRGDRIHHLHWSDLVDPLPQFVLIRFALRRMVATSESYTRSRLTVEQVLRR